MKYSVKHPAIKWPDRADKNFHRRPASGRVRFRDYKGDLISQSVTTLSDLGNKLSNMDDFYICAAKKYYKHFMNIDVDVGDPESISVLPSSVDTYHRNKVILMGLKLKKTQSLRSLLQDIISSDDFRKTDFGMKMYEKAK